MGNNKWSRFEELCQGRLRDLLARVHGALVEDNRHFGYRVAREIARFVVLAAEQTSADDDALFAAVDTAVLAKVLPKLNGTQAELDAVLKRVFDVAIGAKDDAGGDFEAWSIVNGALCSAGSQTPVLPRTATKLWRMQKRLRGNGFVSFIE